MLSNETRKRLVSGYERTHDAKMIAQAYGVSEREVYKLAAQMRETGSVELRTQTETVRGRPETCGQSNPGAARYYLWRTHNELGVGYQ